MRDNTIFRCMVIVENVLVSTEDHSMSGSVNKAFIVGYLGSAPEIKNTSSGSNMAKFSVATNSHWKDQNQNKIEKTEWHRIVIFGRKAEIAGRYLKKGSQVAVEGTLRTNKWTDDTGNDRWSTDIHITDFKGNFTMLGSKDQSSGMNEADSQTPQDEPSTDEENAIGDIPFLP
jgi:single-strand DNA-binding protein